MILSQQQRGEPEMSRETPASTDLLRERSIAGTLFSHWEAVGDDNVSCGDRGRRRTVCVIVLVKRLLALLFGLL
jgi:hypothetical protein